MKINKNAEEICEPSHFYFKDIASINKAVFASLRHLWRKRWPEECEPSALCPHSHLKPPVGCPHDTGISSTHNKAETFKYLGGLKNIDLLKGIKLSVDKSSKK